MNLFAWFILSFLILGALMIFGYVVIGLIFVIRYVLYLDKKKEEDIDYDLNSIF